MLTLYVIYLNKTSINSDNHYSTLNVDLIYTELEEALNKFNELVKEEAEFIADITYIKISDEIILVRKEGDKMTKIKKVNISN